jgi:orotidine-5'-phosphate decarboxylase
LQWTVEYIRSKYPDVFIIADAKRGDIGNTSKMYAKAFFQKLNFDAVTVAPYMGKDSVMPFLEYKGRWVILLALTSNEGSKDFQYTRVSDNFLFEKVLITSKEWGTTDNLMFVTGATQADRLTAIRKIVPDHFLLVPGIGAQGGSLEEVAEFGMNTQCGLIVNSARDIIYADHSEDFARAAGEKAKNIQILMMNLLKKKGLI